MTRKSASLLPSRQKLAREASWAALGADTSMTAISVVGVGYDGLLDKMVGPMWAEIRWLPEDDYFLRLGQAAKGHELVLGVLASLFVTDNERVFLAIEEPFHYGAAQRQIGSWLKQQAEIAGAFKGSLVRYGYTNIYEINNSQWHATLRKEGVPFDRAIRGASKSEKAAIQYGNKFLVKKWAIQAFGLPEFPDLVKSKSGAKVPRPDEGFGAKAKAVQPSDIYDAAACAAWMQDELDRLDII